MRNPTKRSLKSLFLAFLLVTAQKAFADFEQPTLKAPFTLTYEVTFENYVGDSGHEKQTGTSEATVTVSASGNNLLCKSVSSEREHNIIFLYDGKESYYGDSDDVSLSILDRLRVEAMSELPFPGVSIPYEPFMKLRKFDSGGQAIQVAWGDLLLPKTVGPGNTANYVPYGKEHVEITSDGPKVIDCGLYFKDTYAMYLWKFSNHKLINGVWVASDVSFVQVDFDSSKHRAIRQKIHYHATEISDGSLPGKDFNFGSYIRPNNGGINHTVDKKTVSYVYDPHGGDFRTQRERAEALEQANGSSTNSGKSISPVSGIIMLLVLCCGAGGWFWWQRSVLRKKD